MRGAVRHCLLRLDNRSRNLRGAVRHCSFAPRQPPSDLLTFASNLDTLAHYSFCSVGLLRVPAGPEPLLVTVAPLASVRSFGSDPAQLSAGKEKPARACGVATTASPLSTSNPPIVHDPLQQLLYVSMKRILQRRFDVIFKTGKPSQKLCSIRLEIYAPPRFMLVINGWK